MKKPWVFIKVLDMDPNMFGVMGQGFFSKSGSYIMFQKEQTLNPKP